MRSAWLLLLAAALSGCASALRRSSSPVMYSRGVIRIRSAPKPEASVVRETADNERLEYDLIQGGWYRLKSEGKAGEEWAHQGLLNTLDEEMARRCGDAKIRTEDWKWKAKNEDSIATGSIRNISLEPLRNVTARVSYLTTDKKPIVTDTALIEDGYFLPGQLSKFKVVSGYQTGMASATLEFADLKGVIVPSCRRPQ